MATTTTYFGSGLVAVVKGYRVLLWANVTSLTGAKGFGRAG
jgi:hypothetical protein